MLLKLKQKAKIKSAKTRTAAARGALCPMHLDMKLKIFFFFLMLFVFSCTSGKQRVEKFEALKSFKETEPPKRFSDEWHILNRSQHEFSVSVSNEKLQIIEAKHRTNVKLDIQNGTLLGIDKCEWGGKLIFVPHDTSKPDVEIKLGNIKSIFWYKNNIYFLEGLAHLSMSTGAMYRLNIFNNRFICIKVLDFEDAPEVCAVYQDKVFIASFQNFYEIKDFKKKLIFAETFWRSLYPNSIAVFDEENIFLGIRSGIVRLNLKKKEIKFYKD